MREGVSGVYCEDDDGHKLEFKVCVDNGDLITIFTGGEESESFWLDRSPEALRSFIDFIENEVKKLL